MIGRRFGNYEITARLGKGAMGVVYRALDRSLEREVAIKVLPRSFADDPERLARFEREAKLLASLSHPNIAVVHGLLEPDGLRALVMELVPGPSLAERMRREKLPIEESLSIALQVAEAVEEAHEQGIVHRDLKPANVLLTEEGEVKVVDFGLAKSVGSEPPAELERPGAVPAREAADAAPPGFDGTADGDVLGTAGYMSPEQAGGLPVDKRTDVWAFGVVLWELLAGRRRVGGEPVPERLEALLHREIDPAALPPGLVAELRRLLARCLERDPRQRLRDIGEARIEIARLLERLRDPGPAPGGAAEASGLAALAGAFAAGAVLGWLLRGFRGR